MDKQQDTKAGVSLSIFSKKGERVLYLPVDAVRPNPDQPRTIFEDTALRELAQSIVCHGILQPLTVRRASNGTYTLVAGERRLRAAKMAGLTEVPCLPADLDNEDSALLALVENLQRRDLDYWEEALALRRLIDTYGLTQEQVAEQVGKSQSAVANKLRLLKLSPDIITLARSAGLTERHARALLRLPEELRMEALKHIIAESLNVAATDHYIDGLLSPVAIPKKVKRPTILLRDVRLFLNTLNRGVTALKHSGVAADCRQEDAGDAILLTIRIPKREAPREQVS
ncbi:MAG: ParB/RepB/Spo0J family partition protein [Oscillospiraceae bacterium]|nr:ParB/RepB/Spo0J family partition protein [Oscillospiraceae bacterium]